MQVVAPVQSRITSWDNMDRGCLVRAFPGSVSFFKQGPFHPTCDWDLGAMLTARHPGVPCQRFGMCRTRSGWWPTPARLGAE